MLDSSHLLNSILNSLFFSKVNYSLYLYLTMSQKYWQSNEAIEERLPRDERKLKQGLKLQKKPYEEEVDSNFRHEHGIIMTCLYSWRHDIIIFFSVKNKSN